jgi:hypothetical protein
VGSFVYRTEVHTSRHGASTGQDTTVGRKLLQVDDAHDDETGDETANRLRWLAEFTGLGRRRPSRAESGGWKILRARRGNVTTIMEGFLLEETSPGGEKTGRRPSGIHGELLCWGVFAAGLG